LAIDVRAAGRRAAHRCADVTDEGRLVAAVDALVGELGSLDVAHANAGILAPAAPVTDIDLDQWHRVLAVDLKGVLLTFRAALRHLVPRGGVLLATGSSLAMRPGTGPLATSPPRPACTPSPEASPSRSRRTASGSTWWPRDWPTRR
jgi:NAD(P)-dependent dehydrogenase (short-subunit alcohol dehydrogenase family)